MTDTILSQHEEEKCWSLYLAAVSNPVVEVGSFDEFMKNSEPKKTNRQIKTVDLKTQVMKAEKMLSGFIPPSRG